MSELLTLSDLQIANAIQPSLERYATNQHGDYDEIIAQTRRLAQAPGRESTVLAPHIAFVIDASLGVLSMYPELSESICEVITRHTLVASTARRVVSLAGHRGAGAFKSFDKAFMDPTQSYGLPRVRESDIYSFSVVPFQDVTRVSGGVVRLIKEKKIHGRPVDILTRSTGLLTIARMPSAYDDEVRIVLEQSRKKLNYADPKIFCISGDPGEEIVNFTPEIIGELMAHTRRFIRSATPSDPRRSFCPAKSMVSTENPKKTVLEEFWGKIVRYLVQDDATAQILKS